MKAYSFLLEFWVNTPKDEKKERLNSIRRAVRIIKHNHPHEMWSTPKTGSSEEKADNLRDLRRRVKSVMSTRRDMFNKKRRDLEDSHEIAKEYFG